MRGPNTIPYEYSEDGEVRAMSELIGDVSGLAGLGSAWSLM